MHVSYAYIREVKIVPCRK